MAAAGSRLPEHAQAIADAAAAPAHEALLEFVPDAAAGLANLEHRGPVGGSGRRREMGHRACARFADESVAVAQP